MSIPKMRTAQGVLNEIKALDPDTAVTLNRIRAIIKAEKVPVFAAGNKKLVDVAAVLDYLAAGNAAETQQVAALGVIRRVAV